MISFPGVTQQTTSQASASWICPPDHSSSSASSCAASRRGSMHTPGPYPAATRQRAAQVPCRPQPMIPTRSASSRASARAATAATAPVRSAVTAPASSSASGSLVSASLTHTIPMTAGSPRLALPGNDEIHLRIAIPSPRAGIARKSPKPGESR